MTTRTEILKLLADGRFHSGTLLGEKLGVTRAAVCKAIQALNEAGVEIHRVSGRGYKLKSPVQMLDERRIRRQLAAAGRRLPGRLEILEEVDSTNRRLLARAATEAIVGDVCLTEAQPMGRGRRGRHWVTTPFQNLTLSMAWRFQAGPGLVAGLSLAAGVAALAALKRYGVPEAGLKWPNDILWHGRKLAGLLADVAGEASGPSLIVLGVGVNGFIAAREAERIDQPWVDLRTILHAPVDRNRLAALLIAELADMFETFAARGLPAFRAAWERAHLYTDKPVRLIQGETVIRGTVTGIDDAGALILRDARGVLRKFYSGEISLRPAA